MGCGLRKLKPVSEESSPGKIYSTLKRPQVETKVGVAYTYRYLDFLIGKDGEEPAYKLCLGLCVCVCVCVWPCFSAVWLRNIVTHAHAFRPTLCLSLSLC